MSILSDVSIAKLCLPPTHRIGTKHYMWEGLTHTPDEINALRSQPGFMVIHKELAEGYLPNPMIQPFVGEQVRHEVHIDRFQSDAIGTVTVANSNNVRKIVSYGLSSYGYDVRLGNKFKIFTNVRNGMIDPLAPDDNCFVDHEGDFCVIPPNSYILGHTIETFDIPRDVMVVCVGKSTYARLAAIVNVTPIEPGFKGQVVIEIANCSTLPLKVYAGQGIAQFMFFQGDRPCKTSYADKGGKYQNQQGLQTALL